jgi:hypothetical protein
VEQKEVLSVLNAEVNRLPERYRLPIVLCYFQGMSNEEAARKLGHPLGTVQSNLSRGRDRLRDRLARRGVTLSAGLFAAAMTQSMGTAAVAPELVCATLKAALASRRAWVGILPAKVVALAKAGLSSLAAHKLNWTAAVLVALVLAGTGVGLGVLGRTEDSENHNLQAGVRQPPLAQVSVKKDVLVREPRQAPATTLPLTRDQANALIRDLYKRILERDKDDNAYVDDLVRGERDPIEVAWMIAYSKEYQRRFLQNCSHDDAIQTLYAKLFRREPTDREAAENAALDRVVEWRVVVWKVLSDERGKTYAGKIPWTPLDDLWRDVSRWTTPADRVQEALKEKPRDRKSVRTE